MIKIAPSILAADPLNLERDVLRVQRAGCDWLHVDVMDAHFVPNLAYTPAVVRRLREATELPLDVHLMMTDPETILDEFIHAGADCVTIHAEIGEKAAGILDRIRSEGVMAGLALKPDTPLDAAIPLLEKTDLVLMMTVEPGFGGQKLEEHVIRKIGQLRDRGYDGEIEADGGIREDNLRTLVQNGLTVAVMGTALFRAEDMTGSIQRMHRISRGEE